MVQLLVVAIYRGIRVERFWFLRKQCFYCVEEVSNCVGLPNCFTTEHTENTEKTFKKSLCACAVRVLGGEMILSASFLTLSQKSPLV